MLQKIQIVGGMYVTGGAEFALGKRDKPVRLMTKGYVPLLQAIAQKYILFWDEEDKRGWLANGLSALLHMLRGSLEHDKTSKFGAALKMTIDDLQEPSGSYSSSSAVAFLLDERNKSLPIFPDNDGRFIRLQDRVESLCNIMEKLFDQQEDVDKPSGLKFQFRSRASLEGWDFKDIVASKSPLFPKVATLGTFGKSWVDFTRALRVVTILGRGFGELIEPRRSPGVNNACSKWATLPTGLFYLAVHATDLRDIMDAEGDKHARPRLLCQKVFWYNSGQPLKGCPCAPNPVGTQSRLQDCPFDPVQAIFSSTPKLLGRLRSQEPIELTPNGALVFGHSTKIGWYYNDIGDPVQGSPIASSQGSLPPAVSVASSSSAGSSGRQTSSGSNEHPLEDGQVPPGKASATPGTSVSNDSGSAAGVASTEAQSTSRLSRLIGASKRFKKGPNQK